MEGLIQIAIVLILIVVGFSAGRIAERKHFASLDERERAAADILVTASKLYPGAVPTADGCRACMVMGHACISSDYFKTFIAGLKKIIGGEMNTYQSLLTRARREATMRMIDQARQLGCDGVCNVHYDGVDIAGVSKQKGGKGVTMVGIMATGTAYKRAG